jgi:hypothetical protein
LLRVASEIRQSVHLVSVGALYPSSAVSNRQMALTFGDPVVVLDQAVI